MRSFARTAVLVLVALAPAVHAQTSQPKKLYEDALVRERIVRQDLQRARTEEAQSSVLLRVRALAGAYEDMSRLFATSGYADNALWQGAVLSADAFWQFGDARRSHAGAAALLGAQFPLPFQLADAKGRLADQAARGREAVGSSTVARERAAADPPRTPAPTGLAALPAALTSITREVLPEVLRIVIQLGKEVPFYDERIDGPPRVFLDLQNTRADRDHSRTRSFRSRTTSSNRCASGGSPTPARASCSI